MIPRATIPASFPFRPRPRDLTVAAILLVVAMGAAPAADARAKRATCDRGACSATQTAACAAAAATSTGASAAATDQAPIAAHATTPTAATSAPATAQAGMIEGDPAEIGQSLTPDQQRAADAMRAVALDRSTRGLMMARRADGSASVNLQGRFRAYSVVTFSLDGSAQYSCVDGAANAIALAARGASGVGSSVGSERFTIGGPRCAVGPREE